MEYKDFALRLARLREQKGVSARDMSLSMGQNAGYIHNIESGKSKPSITGFFYICEFLKITPKEFFETENENPEKLKEAISGLKKLNSSQLEIIVKLINELADK